METVQVFNLTKGTVIASEARMAASLGARLKGLLGKESLSGNEALILQPCTSIHTFGMRFPIDALFVDKHLRIIRVLPNLPPNRFSPLVWLSQMVIELPAGKLSQTHTQPGDTLQIKNT